mmetsp:Transcript_27559/g.69485  ORF Transcript_27559/g.69485 Transcript_27559/m.69485 type:complete len:233 (-) Transcript_27559:3251-3949(-)
MGRRFVEHQIAPFVLGRIAGYCGRLRPGFAKGFGCSWRRTRALLIVRITGAAVVKIRRRAVASSASILGHWMALVLMKKFRRRQRAGPLADPIADVVYCGRRTTTTSALTFVLLYLLLTSSYFTPRAPVVPARRFGKVEDFRRPYGHEVLHPACGFLGFLRRRSDGKVLRAMDVEVAGGARRRLRLCVPNLQNGFLLRRAQRRSSEKRIRRQMLCHLCGRGVGRPRRGRDWY